MTAFAQDISSIESKKKLDVTGKLVEVARESGRSPFSLAIDYFKLRRKPGKINFSEYFLYELYDRERWSDADREAFVSDDLHWPLAMACNNVQWWSLTEDKMLSASFLEHNGIPTPKTIAVFDAGARHYGQTPKMANGDDVKATLSAASSFPIFAKPIDAVGSFGALRITAVTDEYVIIDGHEATTFEAFVSEMLADIPYLFQTCLTPHSFFEGITDAIGTVRSMNNLRDGQPHVPHAVLKLPRGGNIADNFWRSGNLACAIDPESGDIRSIVAVKNGRRIELDALPESDRTLIGERLPYWDELKEINRDVTLLHSENHFGSTDIAITPDGPVVVEVNNGCALDLIQIAIGKGLLDPEMTAFLRDHGAKI